MKENNRCSTLFHLLVPGGKWQTASVSPVLSASPCNSHFQSRRRQPLLPPLSAVISNRRTRGYRRRPSARHEEWAAMQGVVAGLPYWTYSRRQPQPMDLVNLLFVGSREALDRAFAAARWIGRARIPCGRE